MYGGAAALPFASSGVRRAVLSGGEYLLKTLKGTYLVRPKNILACGLYADITNNFSPFLKNSIELKKFNRVAKYKEEKEFLEALEDGFIKDADAVKRFNENPDLFDEYHEFYKKEKGTVEVFLGKENIVRVSSNSTLTAKVQAKISLYPQIPDPRTGKNIILPTVH